MLTLSHWHGTLKHSENQTASATHSYTLTEIHEVFVTLNVSSKYNSQDDGIQCCWRLL